MFERGLLFAVVELGVGVEQFGHTDAASMTFALRLFGLAQAFPLAFGHPPRALLLSNPVARVRVGNDFGVIHDFIVEHVRHLDF